MSTLTNLAVLGAGVSTGALAYLAWQHWNPPNTPSTPRRESLEIHYQNPDDLIVGKEVKAKLLMESCGMASFSKDLREALREQYPEHAFLDPPRMPPHTTLMENEEFQELQTDPMPTSGDEWKVFLPSQAVQDTIRTRAQALEGTVPEVTLKVGSKSVGLTYPVLDRTVHTTIAYFPEGVPEGVGQFMTSLLDE